MAEQFEQENQEELELSHSPAAVITLIALALLFLGAIAFFGYQTWQFVNWLLPEDSLLMKVLAVINFDVFSYVWLAVGLFLARWTQPLTRTLAVIAGIVTFLLSLGCSVIQIMIASAERFGTNTNMDLVYTAYAFIIVALVWNISTLLGILHIQWPYISGYHPPKKPKNKKGLFGLGKKAVPAPQPKEATYAQVGTSVQPTAQEQSTQQERVFTLDELKVALEQAYERGHQDAKKVSSPLTQPQMETGSQAGNNGSH
ncbi:MAG: hypothetical protein ACJ788_24440 [Ktedonobacteraceae bacterium]